MLDTLRDRRTLLAMVVGPVIAMPLFVILPQKLLSQQFEAQEAAVIKIAVAGAEHAPELLEFLRADGSLEIVETTNPERTVREEQATVGLSIPAGFEVALTGEQSSQITLLGDQSKMASRLQAARVEKLLEAYSQTIVARRLAARGMDVSLLMPFEVRDQNLASPQQMGGSFLGSMLPMFIVLWGLVGGMYTAIDVTAGEKERLTLESLLVTPAGRGQMVLGKLLAVIITSLSALVLAVASMLVAFVLSPPAWGTQGPQGSEVTFSLSLATALHVLLAALPISLMFGGLEMAVCVLARSFKEAQSYVVPLQFVVIIPAIIPMIMTDLALAPWTYAIPIFGAIVILRDSLMGTAGTLEFSIMLGSSILYAGMCIALAVYLFRQERVLFRT